MHQTITWWTIWGLVVGVAIFGLKESALHSLHYVIAIPLLCGAVAAAFIRLKHEYHAAIVHAKWATITTGLLLVGSGYVYLRAEGIGPFATATEHRAFLGTRFGMSPREVERTIGRPLGLDEHTPTLHSGLVEWVAGLIPQQRTKQDVRELQGVVVYRVPCSARFGFVDEKLGRVEIEFETLGPLGSKALLERIHEALAKDYRIDEAKASGDEPIVYRKPSVEAIVSRHPIENDRFQVSVMLQYLPLAVPTPAPLAVNAQVF
jgi:hypothetical protein